MSLPEAPSTDAAPSRRPPEPLDVEQAEAALIEHYPRLVRLAYLVLSPGIGRHRRVLAAHALAQRALPRRRRTTTLGVPLPRRYGGGAAYAYLRMRLLRGVLGAERPRRFGLRPVLLLPGLLPWVFGLRLFPRVGGPDELAMEQALSAVPPVARAVYVLRELEGLPDADIARLLRALEVGDVDGAFAAASGVRRPAGSQDASLLASAEFDACSLQARPTDLLRRRQHKRAAVAAGVAVVACCALIGAPGGSWGPAAAPYAQNPAAQRALDPGALARTAPAAWQHASRRDFAAWPARGGLAGDEALLRRALAVWARPGADVRVSAVRGTPAGPPAGPPRLLYAGRVDGSAVVVLHDGLRVARYAEPLSEDAREARGAVLDLARTDGAEDAAASALVISRAGGTVRYLTAPWVREAAVADLLTPSDKGERKLRRDRHGVTERVAAPQTNPRACRDWPGLLLTGPAGPSLYADLGELTPVRLTDGAPAEDNDATGKGARERLARTACHLPAVLASGVKSVNSWDFAHQKLPEGDGKAAWVCTRAETWRGTGARVLAQFQPPSRSPGRPGAAVARADGSPACGPHDRTVLSGVLWKSSEGHWYVLAAASDDVRKVTARGKGVRDGEATSDDNTLAAKARAGTRARLSGERDGGGRVGPMR